MLRGEHVGDPEALGYDKDDETGKLVINEVEAEIVRYILSVTSKEQVDE